MKSAALWLVICFNAMLLLVLSDCLAIGNDNAKLAMIVMSGLVTAVWIRNLSPMSPRAYASMLKPALNTIAVGLLIGLVFGGAGCAALDKAAPDFAAVPATTQPGGVQTPAIPRNVPAQVAEVALHVTQDPAAQATASLVPWGSTALYSLGAIALLVLGSAHKTQTSNGTTQTAINALANVAASAAPLLPAGPAQTIATDAAAAANAVSNAMSGSPAPSAAAAVVASK
jgi:hypothetical protein